MKTLLETDTSLYCLDRGLADITLIYSLILILEQNKKMNMVRGVIYLVSVRLLNFLNLT